MFIIIKLQGLPLDATSIDVRRYFLGLTIPDGGVHIIGGDEGTVFIEFASDEDARQAMSRGDGKINNSNIKLHLSSRTEMVTQLDVARQLHQNYLQQLQNQSLTNHNHSQQNDIQQQNQRLLDNHSQQDNNNINNQQQFVLNVQPPSYVPVTTGASLMGPALLPTSGASFMGPALLPTTPQINQHQETQNNIIMNNNPLQHNQPIPYEGDPRLLSQNYLGILSQSIQAAKASNILASQQPMSHQSVPPPTLPIVDNNNSNNRAKANNGGGGGGGGGMRGGDDKLFVNKRCVLAASNIPYRATSKDIIEFFSEFNLEDESIRRRYNAKGQPTADAKIAFPTPDAATKALKMMNKKTLCGRPVFLKPV